jgi:hypothetical protein
MISFAKFDPKNNGVTHFRGWLIKFWLFKFLFLFVLREFTSGCNIHQLFVLLSNLENLIRFPIHTSFLQKQTMNILRLFLFSKFSIFHNKLQALTHNMLRWYSFITSLFEGDVGGFLFHPVDKMQHIVV